MRVDLIDFMGDDLTVVNSARVSFSKESNWENAEYDHEDFEMPNYLSDRDVKLINYLAKHGHWTPFSHPQITMREKVPIFVARQRFKHMVGFTYNEVSRRYVDDDPEFFVPDSWRCRPEGSVKQGSGSSSVDWIKGVMHPEDEITTTKVYEQLINYASSVYSAMINADIAPEQARMVLPQSMYTEYYVTGSLAAWARAYKQRIDDHAQLEIQELAQKWGEILRDLYPVSWEALTQ